MIKTCEEVKVNLAYRWFGTMTRFIEEKENIIFVGSQGTGKTHLAISIGIEVALHRNGVHFVTCQHLITDLV